MNYILENHRGTLSIVFCLSKKETEKVAEALSSESDGVIRAAAYHAGIESATKQDLHNKWCEGEVCPPSPRPSFV